MTDDTFFGIEVDRSLTATGRSRWIVRGAKTGVTEMSNGKLLFQCWAKDCVWRENHENILSNAIVMCFEHWMKEHAVRDPIPGDTSDTPWVPADLVNKLSSILADDGDHPDIITSRDKTLAETILLALGLTGADVYDYEILTPRDHNYNGRTIRTFDVRSFVSLTVATEFYNRSIEEGTDVIGWRFRRRLKSGRWMEGWSDDDDS